MTDIKRTLTENLARVRERIAAACASARRAPESVKLIAVTKYAGLDVLKVMPDVGLTDLGESRAPELVKRAAAINEFLSRRARDLSAGAMPRPHWHMIGHLQRNKVKLVLPWTEMVHSVDSLRLAEEVNTRAGSLDRVVDVLLQVNCSGEESKFGVAVGAVTHLAEMIAPLPHISLCGLMTMAPYTEDETVIRSTFTRCQELFDEIRHDLDVGPQFRHLSMGMSHDFEIAIACGATIVRIGTALFEGLPTVREETADADAVSAD
ncbi:MAG TPA: YggS family pyridoxal phosphate-dependent enzyme [Phycisphaerae bacterium]|nr:YggS family pyridoxal phosphate-dependent enzyme [Phycisphaerales bacterium]HRX83452.1 YggS family pyridoxal phosphate-dependent enzyme [Phycisphaerae bacterium]